MNWIYEIAAIILMILAGGTVWVVEDREIESLKAQISQMQAQDAIKTAQFLEESAKKQQELENERNAVVATYFDEQDKSNKLLSDLRGRNVLLNSAIDSFAKRNDCQLPKIVTSPGIVSAAQTEGELLKASIGLSTDLAGQAEALADQLRALQALK